MITLQNKRTTTPLRFSVVAGPPTAPRHAPRELSGSGPPTPASPPGAEWNVPPNLCDARPLIGWINQSSNNGHFTEHNKDIQRLFYIPLMLLDKRLKTTMRLIVWLWPKRRICRWPLVKDLLAELHASLQKQQFFDLVLQKPKLLASFNIAACSIANLSKMVWPLLSWAIWTPRCFINNIQ